jgi:hypothetical protein
MEGLSIGLRLKQRNPKCVRVKALKRNRVARLDVMPLKKRSDPGALSERRKDLAGLRVDRDVRLDNTRKALDFKP